MRLSQSESVVLRGNDHKFRNKFKGKRKHKKLDAICEKSYSSSHKRVEKVESSEINNGGDELELRRSNRARKAPVLLDSSPVPPRKRRRVDRSVQCETPCSSSRDVDEQSDGWRTRLRSRGKSTTKGKRKLFEDSDDESGDEDMDPPSYDKKDESEEGEKSTFVKSKRPGRIKASNILVNENTEIDEGLEVMDDVVGLHLEVNLECGNENGVENGHVGSDMSEGDEAAVERDPELEECHTNGNVETGEECNVPEEITSDNPDQENVAEADCAPDDQEKDDGRHDKPLDDDDQEKDEWRHDKPLDDDDQEKDEGRHDKPLDDDDQEKDEGRHDKPLDDDDQEKDEGRHDKPLDDDDQEKDEGRHDKPLDDDDQEKDEGRHDKPLDDDQEKDEGRHDMPLDDDYQEKDEGRHDMPLDDDYQEKDEGRQDKCPNDEACTKSKGIGNVSAVVDRKPRIKLGRRCGLCGGGTDGKPPRILVLEGAGSDNEAYSGSSGSEVPNYDVLDGFCDQPGWLGRLLGPINDRFGIAGIWVHQQCAVWSPEVYFAGLGCLKNVRAALYRGRVLKCSRCGRPGATIGCRVDRCPKTYHLPCARSKSCIFDHRKFLIACTDHRRLFQPHGIQNAQRIKKMKAKKLKLELRKVANDACRKDIEAEEKWLENCGEDEEFLKRESKRLHRDLWRIAPTYIGGSNTEPEKQYQGWESVAGLQDVIRCMKEVVILPLLYPEFFSNIGLTPPRGVLLHGHPGTGKTLVVRALVGSCARGDRKIAYFARKGADCLGKYVGDSERQLRLLFQVAEKSQPSIIFFDEIDGLAPCRTKQQDQTHNSVVSTLLALMDGLKSRGSVIVIGATNRPDAVDPALRRPGRFDREIYFPLPSVKDREAILSLHTQKWPKPVTGTLLKWVAQKTLGFAGADLQALCTQAAIIALRRSFPLHEVLSAAEKRATESKCPAIPSFSVEERDWLKALSCAPPPCSRRESGIALNDVVSSPLEIHLVPCLLLPLTRLLVRLYLDERVWLPPHLKKAATLVKHIFVSALSSRSVQSDNWWLRMDDLLHEADVVNEIEKNMLLANVLVGESNLCGSNVRDENTDEGCLDISPSKSQCIGGARPGLLQKMSNGDCNKSGFQVLICGNPRSGQRHLASCLVHYFVGNVDVWKIDLAGISHEGHGDMVLGLTHLLMRCARSSLCLLYMPMIDLWAIETFFETSEDGCEVDMENGLHLSNDVEATWSQPTVKKASYIWTSFIEQVESMRVNTSLIVLATSELPLSSLPNRISQFFGDESLNCSFSNPLDHKVPRFSVQLDGNFNHDKVINSFAAKLTKDLTQHFVHSLRGENHNLEKSEKSFVLVKGDVCQIKRSHVSSSTPVLSSKTIKNKSSLSLAIATFGYQILCYPHFAELCWVTSKLKDGPFANTNGPWKGWPFNSCIVRPVDSTEKVVIAQSGSSNTKTKESGLVRGLVAVALSAYRGEYTSLREVCAEVRKVMETLVRRIDDKIQAGKDRSLFIRILSQVAYLEDMIISWAHALYSLEVDTHKLEVLDVNIRESEVLEKSLEKVCAGRSDPTAAAGDEVAVNDNGCADADDEVAVNDNGCADAGDEVAVNDNGCADAGDEVAVTEKEDTLASNGVNLESSFKSDTAAGLAESVSVKLSNDFFKDSGSDIQPEGPSLGSGENMISKPSSSTCFYECCFECYVNLRNLLPRIINNQWEAVKGNESTVEDIHDFVASLSANLFLSLSNLFEGENYCGIKTEIKGGEKRKRCKCECKKSDKLSMVECGCHATTSRGLDSRFVFKDGVLAASDTDTAGGDVSCHCKFEKLCLCVLIGWLERSKEEIIH